VARQTDRPAGRTRADALDLLRNEEQDVAKVSWPAGWSRASGMKMKEARRRRANWPEWKKKHSNRFRCSREWPPPPAPPLAPLELASDWAGRADKQQRPMAAAPDAKPDASFCRATPAAQPHTMADVAKPNGRHAVA
jgi:hypothetical protein